MFSDWVSLFELISLPGEHSVRFTLCGITAFVLDLGSVIVESLPLVSLASQTHRCKRGSQTYYCVTHISGSLDTMILQYPSTACGTTYVNVAFESDWSTANQNEYLKCQGNRAHCEKKILI